MASENATTTSEAKEEEGEGTVDDARNVGTPTVDKDTANSTPDITPSRRSARKKQTTFSSDFEYYTPTGRKKEIKEEDLKPGIAPAGKGRKGQKKADQKQNGDKEEAGDEEEGKEEGEEEDDESRKPMKRKVAVRKKKGKAGEIEEGKEEAPEENEKETPVEKPKAKRGRPKGSVKKQVTKVPGVRGRKKKIVTQEDDGKEANEEKEDESTPKSTKAGRKRKKMVVKAKEKGKKAKTNEEKEEISSDEDEDTPISQLKAQIEQDKPEVKKMEGVAQNLVKKLAEAGSDTGSDLDKSPIAGLKRKLTTGEKDEEVPAKKQVLPKPAEKLAPAQAGLVKRAPPPDAGLVKRAPSEVAAKTNSAQKTSQPSNVVVKSEKAPESKETSDASKGAAVPIAVKKEDGIAEQKRGSKVKPVKKEKELKVEPKIKPEVKKATEIKVIKKADGTIIRGKVIPGKGNLIKTADGKIIKIKVNQEKGGDKVVAGGEKPKPVTSGEKGLAPLQKSKGHISKVGHEKIEGKAAATGDHRQKNSEVQPSISDSRKPLHKLKKRSPEEKKNKTKSEVEDLLKRGIIHKKKSHQPFGNKKVVPKPVVKDVKKEPSKEQASKEEQQKKKTSGQKSNEKREVKKPKDVERRKSSDASKHGKDRSHSTDSSKGERRKSSESSKKSEKSSNEVKEESSEDGPPPLVPANAVGSKPKPKHHHKPEHEVPVDMTMMDLFKPDGLIVHDQQKKEEGQPESSASVSGDGKSQDAQSSDSYVKPDHVHHVLMEHQYSKPSSPAGSMDNQKNVGTSAGSGRDEDIESVSHKQTDFMDVTLPDQILDEPEDVVQESHENFQETWPDSMVELQQMVKKSDPADRPSILESLDTELKESGTEFRIVGQVEVERVPAVAQEESVSSTTLTTPNTKYGHSSKQEDSRKKHDNGKIGEQKSSSDPLRKPSLEKRKDSVDKQKDTTEKRKEGLEKRKDSTERRKDSTEKRKDSTENRKDGSEKRKKSEDEKDKDKRKPKKKIKPDGAEATGDEEDEEGKDHESDEHTFEDDEDDFDWEPNDPDAQYCICRKPHNNRFMICCDKCEEWFHGTCVGITRARGKEMEEKEEEYVCPVCITGDKPSVLEKPSTPKGGESPSTPKPKLQQKCIGRKCSKTPRPGSVYCSNECIMNHAQDSLKALREEQMRKKAKEKQESSSSTSSSVPKVHSSSSADVVEVVERETGKILKGTNAPTQKGLHRWLEQHPSFEVVQPHKHRSSSSRDDKHRDKDKKSDRDRKSSSDKDRKSSTDKRSDKDDRHRHGDRSRHDSSSSKDSSKRSDSEKRRSSSQKSDSSSSSRQDEKKDDGPNQIRLNVRTALRDSLTTRAHEADDIMLSSTEIKSLAVTIEEELFAFFNDTGHKYRTKYRSLIFNIKDQKNKGLFRKILTGKIKPHKLVQMSTEDLASRELAKWREQESKHQLEMIEKTEQEALKQSETVKHVRKKTHKGEVEVEDEDLSILETRIEEKKDLEPESQEEQSNAQAIDTTDQHRAHLFDLNCKVCTGKIVPGPEEQAAIAAANKLKQATLAHSGEESKEDESSVDKEDYIKAEEIVKEALRTMQKTEQEVSSLPKIVSTSPKEDDIPLPLSPKISTPGRESNSSASSTSSSSKSSTKKVVVRSPDSALQSGLEAKPKFTPTGPMLWKGFVSMLDVAKFFTSAYRVSGPTDHITIPDTIHIMGRISPDHMWDYLSKIRQAGSQDLTIIRFIPGSDDEKVAYVHLYSYLNSRSRCGVAGNPNKQVKDFYVVPLASHSKIPRTLLPFDGPGLEENRPHMLIGILVRQRGKHGGDSSDSGSSSSTSKTSTQVSTGATTSTTTTTIIATTTTTTITSGSTIVKKPTAPINRDPRLAKLAAAQEASQPKASPAESNSSSSSTSNTSSAENKPKPTVEVYDSEYVPMPIKPKGPAKPVAEYIPTPTAKKKEKEKDPSLEKKKEEGTPVSDDSSTSKEGKEKHHHHHHHHKEHHHHGHQGHHDHHHHHDDSEPYSPSKEAEPYSPGQEAAADEPYDPEDESLMDEDGIPIATSSTVSSSSAPSAAILPTSAPVTSNIIATSSAAAVVAALSSSITATQSEQILVPAVETVNTTDELVEKMARSNDPQEISSLMVTALSAASSPQEQQKLLVELTKKVEERKLQLAEAARKGVSSHSGVAGSKVETVVTKASFSNAGTVVDSGAGKPVAAAVGGDVASGLLTAGMVSSAPGSSVAAATVSSSPESAAGTGNTALSTAFTSGASETAWDQSLQTSASSSTLSSSTAPFSHSPATSSILSPSTIPLPQDTKPSQSSTPTVPSSSTAPLLPSSALSSSAPLPSTSAPAVPSVTPASVTKTVSDSGATELRDTKGIKFSFTKSLTKTSQPISSQAADAFQAEVVDPKPKLPLLGDDSPSNYSEEVQPKAGPSGEIPDALKALMDDVLGNTQVSSLEKRRKLLLKKEAEKVEKAAKEAAKEEEEASQAKQSEEELQAEAKKRLEDEMEGRRILDSMKKTETVSGSSLEGNGVATTASSAEQKPESAEGKPASTTTTAPSIDELLDRLKKGGFQFPLQQSSADSGAATVTSSSIVSTSALSSSAPSDSTSLPQSVSQIPLPSSSALSSASSSELVSSTSSSLSASALDVDMRQKNGPPSSVAVAPPPLPPTLPPPHTSSGDFDARVPSVPLDRDDRAMYQDRDERLYRPPHPPLAKHPLDPHAFPPLPNDSRGYPHHPLPPPPLTGHPPPPHTAHPPPPHTGLHPHYSEPHMHVPPYHPTPRSSIPPGPVAPKGRAQPPPPGTEFDKPAGVLGITKDFPPSDVDLRNRNNRPPLPPDQPLPPLPPQPPPPLPPLPGNRGPYPHPPPGDMDYRAGDHYGPHPPPHHSDYRHHGYPGPGRGRPYHRH